MVINIDWGDKSPGASHAAAGRTGGWAAAKALCTFERLRRWVAASRAVAETGHALSSSMVGDCACCMASRLVPKSQCGVDVGRGCGNNGGRLPSSCWQTAANAPGSWNRPSGRRCLQRHDHSDSTCCIAAHEGLARGVATE